ncbi:MAG: ribokinase [Firmicutes bacterium]|nr:ribokinase [Bacillota bacterium]
MKILNLGSLNLDYVYQVDHMVQPGETLASSDMQIFCGGKGLNQSIALAKAGADVYHGGLIGEEGGILRAALQTAEVDCQFVRTIEGSTGHAIIQVDGNGQNCILLYGGTNRMLTSQFIDEVLAAFDAGDILLLQNEVNKLDEIVDKAHKKGMKIVLNPSPFNDAVKAVDLEKISLFLMNEVEGEQITGEADPAQILQAMKRDYPQAEVVLTMGAEGAWYQNGDILLKQNAFKVEAVDTTAAGDTFTGYFLATQAEGMDVADSLEMASKASSIAVTRPGAAPSIPMREELNQE